METTRVGFCYNNDMDLGALTEAVREQVEGKSLPVGSFVQRKSGTYRKMKDGRWSKVRKIKAPVQRAKRKSKGVKLKLTPHLKRAADALANRILGAHT